MPEPEHSELLNDEMPLEPEVEPGGLRARLAAGMLDIILIALIAVVVVTRIILPQHPGVVEEFQEIMERQRSAAEAGQEAPSVFSSEEMSPELIRFVQTATLTTFGLFWAFFTVSPLLMRGSTLGMRVFNLRIVRADIPLPASFQAYLFRGFAKTFCLQILSPFLWAFFLLAAFNHRRMAGHDYLARTRVIRGFPRWAEAS